MIIIVCIFSDRIICYKNKIIWSKINYFCFIINCEMNSFCKFLIVFKVYGDISYFVIKLNIYIVRF